MKTVWRGGWRPAPYPGIQDFTVYPPGADADRPRLCDKPSGYGKRNVFLIGCYSSQVHHTIGHGGGSRQTSPATHSAATYPRGVISRNVNLDGCANDAQRKPTTPLHNHLRSLAIGRLVLLPNSRPRQTHPAQLGQTSQMKPHFVHVNSHLR